MRVTYAHLVAVVARSVRLPKSTTRKALRVFFEQLAIAVWAKAEAEGGVSVPRLGSFTVRHRRPHRIRNPQTHDLMELKSGRAVICRVAKSWRRRDG